MVDATVFEARLEQELARVRKRIADLKREPEPEELAAGGDNTPLSEDVDAAAVAREKELSGQVLNGLLQRAEALEEALRRAAEGSYGICVACKNRIPESRLGVLPEVALCASCQTKKEQGEGRRAKGKTTRIDSGSAV